MAKAETQGPSAKQIKKFTAFRCPPDLLEWIQAKLSPKEGVTLTDGIVWTLEMGREYVTAIAGAAATIERISQETGLKREVIIERALQTGLAALEKESPRRK